MKPRNEWIDFLKGVLILLVVTGHTVQYGLYRNMDYLENGLFKAIYMFHMPLFMAVAGYLAAQSIDSTSPVRLLLKRFCSYLLPVFAWALMFQVFLRVLCRQARLDALPADFLNEALSSHWFLWALFASTAVVAIARQIGGSKLVLPLIILPLVLALPEAGNIPFIQYMFPFFLAGYFAASWKAPGRAHWWCGFSAVVAVACFLAWTPETYIYLSKMRFAEGYAGNIALRFLGGAAASVFFLTLCRSAFSHTPPRIRQVVAVAGRDSIYIYILQNYLFWALERWIHQHPHFAPNHALGTALAIPAAVVITGFIWALARMLGSTRWSAGLLFGRWEWRSTNDSSMPDPAASEMRHG